MLHVRTPIHTKLLLMLANWVTTVAVASFCQLVQLLPKHSTYRLAPVVGRLLRMGSRDVIIDNMKMVLGSTEWSREQWITLWNAHIKHVGLTIIESIRFLKMNKEQLCNAVSIEGERYLRKALQSGRGAMLFVNHQGNVGCLIAGLGARGYDVSIAGNAMPLAYVEKKVKEMYMHGGVKRVLLGDQLPSRIAQTLQNNAVFGVFIDLTVVRKHNVWVPFGHAQIMINLGPAILAVRNQADVLCVSCMRLPGNRHRLIIHPPLQRVTAMDTLDEALHLLQEAMNVLSEDIRVRPDQWWAWDWTPVRENVKIESERRTRAPMIKGNLIQTNNNG